MTLEETQQIEEVELLECPIPDGKKKARKAKKSQKSKEI